MARHLVTLFDLADEEVKGIFTLAARLKEKFGKGLREPLLAGHTMALLFEKPSLRTRVSFETAFTHLGGSSLFLGDDVGWGKRESIEDFSRVLSQFVDVIVCRSKAHAQVVDLAKHSRCPVINGLTDECHPCQALADLFTLREVHGSLAGRKLAYIGDANNVARSLAVACGRLGVRLAIAAPTGYQFDEPFLSRLKGEVPKLELSVSTDPGEAVAGADGVYTDVWVSMGQESERKQRQQDLAAYQVNAQLMARAPDSACFLHCLPANRGEEVTADVIDGPQSAILQQAANRMHVQKAVLAWLLDAKV